MIELIPAIDIIDGKCVRLSQGDYERMTTYNHDPLEVAKEFQDHGIRRLHVVDLDGAKAHHIVNYKALERIASRTSLIIDFGGRRLGNRFRIRCSDGNRRQYCCKKSGGIFVMA